MEDKDCPFCHEVISRYTVPGGMHISDKVYASLKTCYKQECRTQQKSITRLKSRKKVMKIRVILSPIDLFNSGRWSEI